MQLFMKSVAVSALMLALGAVSAFAGNGAPSGAHFQINFVGHPMNKANLDAVDGALKNDGSNGRAILIPLKNVPGGQSLECSDQEEQTVVYDDIYTDGVNWVTSEPAGAKIYFTAGDHYEIIDRDATDKGGAEIMLKTMLAEDTDGTMQPVRDFDVYVRVLGKPNTCMGIDGWAYDADQLNGVWFNSGHISLARKAGQSTFVKANELFDVDFCTDVSDDGTYCEGDTLEDLSVWNDVFDSYFWSVINDGTRVVQVRFYPRAD